MSLVGKSASDGFRWGQIIEEEGCMIKIKWEQGDTSDWRNSREFEIPGRYDDE